MKVKVQDNKLIFDQPIFTDKSSAEVECDFFEDRILIWLKQPAYRINKHKALTALKKHRENQPLVNSDLLAQASEHEID